MYSPVILQCCILCLLIQGTNHGAEANASRRGGGERAIGSHRGDEEEVTSNRGEGATWYRLDAWAAEMQNRACAGKATC